MPGKGKVKGKKKLKKGYNNKLREENSVTAYATTAQDNVASPIPKDALAAEFSNILDDLKNNNKVCYPEEDKGRGILQSMLKVASKRDEEVKGGVGVDNGHMKRGRDEEDLEINCFKRGNPVVEEDHYEENNTLQVLSSIVDPMSQLSEKVSKIQLSEMLDSEITTSDESTTFNGDEAEILQEDDVKQHSGRSTLLNLTYSLRLTWLRQELVKREMSSKIYPKILLKTNVQNFRRRCWSPRRVV